jgi:hypothetical protein
MSDLSAAAAAHDKDMARDFLSCLDPKADRFTFQFFADGGDRYARIFHGTLDEVWPKVQTLNTPTRGVGVFVAINETDFKGRRNENIVRVRAVFVDADTNEQVRSCEETLTACGVTPSLIVSSGRGVHYYFFTDIPCGSFRGFQENLIRKLGTDPAVKDLPRVMRLPGTLHLKNATDPRLVRVRRTSDDAKRWQPQELWSKLRFFLQAPRAVTEIRCNPSILPAGFSSTPGERERLQNFFGKTTDRLSDGLEADIEEIRSAVLALPSSAISTEIDWMRFARALAHEAAVRKDRKDQLWEILDNASRPAPGYNEEENKERWSRYISEAFNRENPITIATVFDLAYKNGWHGWSPPMADFDGANASAAAPVIWRPDELKVSFLNIPHRQWLFGVDLVRGELTVIGSPGGVGKSSLAIGMAVSIATGTELLGEKVRGGAISR